MDYPQSSPPAKIFIMVGVGVLVFLLLLVLIVTQALKNKPTATATTTPQTTTENSFPTTEPPFNPKSTPDIGSTSNVGSGTGITADVVATVGKETLYKEDLDQQMSLYAGDATKVPKAEFVNQLVKDSIILQAGADAGFIKLDSLFFNAADKNYILRAKNVQDVKDKIQSESNSIDGYVVSIWFANDVPPAMGADKAKAFAYQKIVALQQQVKLKQITVQQAGAQIKADTSLAQIDEAYKVNAIFPFSKKQGQLITISKELDAALWQQPIGGVTDVILVKSMPTYDTKDVDAVYMFGQVTGKTGSGTISNFDTWYDQQKTKYAVKTM
jgi:hypothetical protein